MRYLILILLLSLAACEAVPTEDAMDDRALPALIRLCLSDDIITITPAGEVKRWKDTRQCKDALRQFNGR